MKITYEFVTGEISGVEVDESLGGMLLDLDRQQYNKTAAPYPPGAPPPLPYLPPKQTAPLHNPFLQGRHGGGSPSGRYEMQGQIVPALAMFEQCGKKERIRELLIRNARLNPGNGHYFELRRYYLQMEERELEESPVLMAGMSIA